MKKILCALLLAAVLCLSGCSGKAAASPDSGNAQYDTLTPEASQNKADVGGDALAPADSAASARKLIQNSSLTVQTRDFDAFVSGVSAKITELGGYAESSRVSGTETGASGSRYAEIVARIPADRLEQFTGTVSSLGTVISRQTSVSDITMTYVDTEARLSALRAEQESLLRLLESAESVSDIIALRDRLSNVQYELESYQSKLRTYDNLVQYSTVTLNISEVEREEDPDAGQSVWSQIGANLSKNFYMLGKAAQGLFVWFVSSLPFLAIIGVIVFVIVYFAAIRPARKKRAAAPKKTETPNKNTGV